MKIFNRTYSRLLFKTTLLACAFALQVSNSVALENTFSNYPIVKETQKISYWSDSQWRVPGQENLNTCKIQISLGTHPQTQEPVVKFRMGVLGGMFAAFGDDVLIPLSALPLKEGFQQIYKTPGLSTMVLNYRSGKLVFKWLRSDGLWNVLNPFELTIDPALQNPTQLKARIEGFESDIFGFPKKHVVQSCSF